MIIDIIVVMILIGLDRLVKWLTVPKLANDPVVVIDGVFNFTRVENRGAAFGSLQDQRLFLLIITGLLIGGMLYVYYKMPREKKYNLLRFTLILIFSGAIGNLIDRVFLGYVIDTFHFVLINFAVFNVADSYVVVGSILLVLLTLFKYSEEELNFVKLKRGNDE